MGIRVAFSRHLAPIMVAGLWIVLCAAAHAGPICAGKGCATSASATGETTQETASRPVSLNKFKKRAGSKSAIRTRIAAKRAVRAAKTAQYSRVAARVKKASKKFTVAAAAKPAVVEEPIKESVANARAEISDAEMRLADASNDIPITAEVKTPEKPNVQFVAADQVNDIDRAATERETAPKTVGKAPSQAASAAVASNDSTWDQTSFIGKLFVAFGGLLTLASAARLFIA